MPGSPAHLFVDISSHGFGHLAQTAPVLNRLAELQPDLRITLRSGLPAEKIGQRIKVPCDLIASASDFGYVMHDALRIDLAATATAYRLASANFSARADADATLFEKLGIDTVLANVSYLPLAGAARAGIPAVAMCSLNWADLFQHYFGHESWAGTIHAEMLDAYRAADFLRTTPGMEMPALERLIPIGPIASIGVARNAELRHGLGISPPTRILLVALGGIPTRLPVEAWPQLPDTHYLVPAGWNARRADISAFEPLAWPFSDLLRSVDAIVTKPGYGTFAEAACNGTAVLYQRREDWPEQDCLIDWLQANARAGEISGEQLARGDFGDRLASVLAAAVPPAPTPAGIEQAARHIARLLT